MTGKRVLVTGADGFIGRNLCVRLQEAGHRVVPFTRRSSDLAAAVADADAVVHLAGANRPQDPAAYMAVNRDLSAALASALAAAGRAIPLLYASSVRAVEPSDYGRSKHAGEQVLQAAALPGPIHVFRLPNVFGKWSRPDYNSAVATFCHNVGRDLPIAIHEPDATLDLVHVDDVVGAFLELIGDEDAPGCFHAVAPVYRTTVGALAETIRGFRADRRAGMIADVGTGLTRALYATYVSFLPPAEFQYAIPSHRDPRGAFSEVLRTRATGQFSVFNALPGVTRGGHYHHSKTEKFLIVHGRARFRFRHVLTGERHAFETSADDPVIVETVPGWAHDVTNIGDDLLVSLLWANEAFDRARPDTVAAAL